MGQKNARFCAFRVPLGGFPKIIKYMMYLPGWTWLLAALLRGLRSICGFCWFFVVVACSLTSRNEKCQSLLFPWQFLAITSSKKKQLPTVTNNILDFDEIKLSDKYYHYKRLKQKNMTWNSGDAGLY